MAISRTKATKNGVRGEARNPATEIRFAALAKNVKKKEKEWRKVLFGENSLDGRRTGANWNCLPV